MTLVPHDSLSSFWTSRAVSEHAPPARETGLYRSLHITSSYFLANRRTVIYVRHIPIGLKREERLRQCVPLAMIWRRNQDWFHWVYCTDLNKGIPLQRGLPCSRSTSLPVITFPVWVIQFFERNELELTSFNNKSQEHPCMGFLYHF